MTLSCPRDKHELLMRPQTRGSAFWCNVCSGVFLEALLPATAQPISLAKSSREPWDPEVLCPKDGQTMQFVVFEGVSIDFCAKCRGVWLDGEEVELFLGTPQAPQSKKTGSALSEADFLSPIVGAIVGALLSP